jgi:hypothetical protein
MSYDQKQTRSSARKAGERCEEDSLRRAKRGSAGAPEQSEAKPLDESMIPERHRKIFWGYTIVAGPKECWLWTAPLDKDGYGAMQIRYKRLRAHRISYAMHNGPLKSSELVLHKCDNPRCVNPNHLFTGSQADNVKDRDKKQRMHKPKGELHPMSKLTEEKVRFIRANYVRGLIRMKDLAAMLGVNTPAVCNVVNRRAWNHIP